MPRVNISDLDKYSSGGSGASYFKLANDKDVATVRYMIDGIDDLNDYAFVVHRVKIGDKERDVNCLREYNDPVDVCPLCEARYKYSTKVFIPLYDVDTEEVKIWPRGNKYIHKLQGLCGRYKNLVSHIFEIERNGKPKDMQTTYENYEQEQDDTTLEDLPEVPDILGTLVLDKTAEDMEYYLQEGEFPPDGDDDEKPVKRSRRRDEEDENDEEVNEKPVRRNRRRDEDDDDDDEEEVDERPVRRARPDRDGNERRRPSARRDRKENKF